MKNIFMKSLLLCSLFAMSMGLQAKFKIVNATDSKILIKVNESGVMVNGYPSDPETHILAPGAPWATRKNPLLLYASGPDFLEVARHEGMGASYAPWHKIDIKAKFKEIKQKEAHHKGETVLWNIVPTLFGYDVEIDWEKGDLGTF